MSIGPFGSLFDTVDPTISGTALATLLNNFKDAMVSGNIGPSRPALLKAGGTWVDSTNDPTTWAFKIYTGTTDITIFTLNLVSGIGSVALGVDSFQVKKVSADTAGAILGLIKQRIASNGQVLNGDVVGEIRVTGRTNTSTNPVVAKIIWTATDDQTTSSYGGTLSFQSTPDATNTLTEHFRLINGLVETVVPHKLNSLILVPNPVTATGTAIAQLSASKSLVEISGSAATDIQGINSGNDAQVITIHNRSTAAMTLKHQNGSAAAADRMKLPNAADYVIAIDASATLYYCTTDSLWKLVSTSELTSTGFTIQKLYAVSQTFTVPSTTSVIKVRGYKKQRGIMTERNAMLDVYGNAAAWGLNTNGQIGDGTVTPKSSPVAVLGGLAFQRMFGLATGSTFGIASTGAPFAWGLNTSGQLGVGDVIPRSSPVAVSGSLRFSEMYGEDSTMFGLTPTGVAFAWGINANGQCGNGGVVPLSAPTAVLGSLKFAKLSVASGGTSNAFALGLTTAGAAVAWGINTNGNLGVNDVTARSSPVAVLGSHTFADIQASGSDTAGRYWAIGLDTAGAAWCWGANTKSVLGDGTQTSRSSPVAVLGGLTFTRIFASPKGETAYGLTAAGALYAWGENSQGQIGDGTTVDKSSPIAVLGGLVFVKVIVYRKSVWAITADGTAYSWGANAVGQIGDATVVAKSSPVAVLGGLKFSDIGVLDAATDQYTPVGMDLGGNVYCWGSNTNGSVGDGSVLARSSPVAVLGSFSADAQEYSVAFDLTVTGGTGYTVTMGAGMCAFGSQPIGRDIYRVEIEYAS